MNVNIRKKRKLGVTISLALAAIIAIAATFAWLTAYDHAKNHLDTAFLDEDAIKIVEEFIPPDEWKPGQEVTKKVAVANTGDLDMLVRVSFEEVMETLKYPLKYATSPIETTSGSGVDAINIPQLVRIEAYKTSEWTKLSESGLTVTGLPDDVTGIARKTILNEGTPKERTQWDFILYHKIMDGPYKDKYQRVTADVSAKGNNAAFGSVKYFGYSGTDINEKAWAKFAKPQTNGVYTKVTRGAIDHPITDTPKMITINYTNRASAVSTTITDGTWWYNEDDGFFYYIGKLVGGTTTTNLIDSLKLSEKAGTEYGGMKFDLIVNMESIQNTADALESTEGGGWGLTNADLLAKLKAFCD
jgi:hypothetical protein